MLVLFCVGLTVGIESSGIIAYDCADPAINMTSYSLLDVASCVPPSSNIVTTEETIQVLQRNAKSLTKVSQCKVIIQRLVRHCGMHSHTSDYEHGYAYIVKEFTTEECIKAHQLAQISLSEQTILRELKMNSTTRGETLIAGSVHGSNCVGETYRTPSYTWVNALVYYRYEITLSDYMADVDMELDQVVLRKGLVCTYSTGRCLDAEEGYLTWDVDLNM